MVCWAVTNILEESAASIFRKESVTSQKTIVIKSTVIRISNLIFREHAVIFYATLYWVILIYATLYWVILIYDS
jgi:hypothetical protein